MLAIFGRKVEALVEAADLTGHLDRLAGHVESSDPADAAHAVLGGIPESLPANSVGTDSPNSRNDDAAFHAVWMSCFAFVSPLSIGYEYKMLAGSRLTA
jgi:hypothetical protein